MKMKSSRHPILPAGSDVLAKVAQAKITATQTGADPVEAAENAVVDHLEEMYPELIALIDGYPDENQQTNIKE